MKKKNRDERVLLCCVKLVIVGWLLCSKSVSQSVSDPFSCFTPLFALRITVCTVGFAAAKEVEALQ